ncbi:hypothetical protein D3C85_912900 [compost metagenome]
MNGGLHAVTLGKDDHQTIRVQLAKREPLAAKGQLAFDLMIIIKRTMPGADGDMVAIDQCVLLIKLITLHHQFGISIRMLGTLASSQPFQIDVEYPSNTQCLVDSGQRIEWREVLTHSRLTHPHQLGECLVTQTPPQLIQTSAQCIHSCRQKRYLTVFLY